MTVSPTARNERASDPDWIVRLRGAMDSAGHEHVTIVASDTSFSGAGPSTAWTIFQQDGPDHLGL